MPVTRIPLEQRFWSKVNRLGEDDCWIWTAMVNHGGYGTIKICVDVPILAHRLSWNIAHPDDLLKTGECVCHSCDNPPCVNPKHLWKGTNIDNRRDMVMKGRGRGPHLLGSSNPSSKLKESDIPVIRKLRKQGYANWAIADTFGVSEATISGVLRGSSWKGVK